MNPSVLVVDDDHDLRLLARLYFSHDGWSVTEACSAESAVEIARLVLPDVVVLDDHLGDGRRGSQSTLELKCCSPGSRIILFTATPISRHEVVAVDDVISKAQPIADVVRSAASLTRVA